ncbi:hypothetical protein NDU88_006785 [Pleurodeles waltl]|uniref:Uncharacterized protein n=1 Tax=Pleurodeles waltl TaxID=8319 RepID=A0AAV7UNS8_PLEWA|nr:hypothetical protein NDU88_006785 [Pleurodeles waltl]
MLVNAASVSPSACSVARETHVRRVSVLRYGRSVDRRMPINVCDGETKDGARCCSDVLTELRVTKEEALVPC